MKRKEFIKSSLVAGAGLALTPAFARCVTPGNMTGQFELPDLPYAYNALEPYIDEQTMMIHHDKHFKAYLDKLNQAIDGTPMAGLTVEDILAKVDGTNAALRNNAGGYYNHTLFFESLSPKAKKMPEGKLAEAINTSFGSLETFQKQFNDAAKSVFGSGWAWLSVDANKKLQVISTPNQDNPLMGIATHKSFPLFGIDVWEHAYYLKYQNLRADYVNAFWSVLDWGYAEKRFASL